MTGPQQLMARGFGITLSLLVTPEQIAAIKARRLDEAYRAAEAAPFADIDAQRQKRRIDGMTYNELGMVLRFSSAYLQKRLQEPDRSTVAVALLSRGSDLVYSLGVAYLEGKRSMLELNLVFDDARKGMAAVFDEAVNRLVDRAVELVASELQAEMQDGLDMALLGAEQAQAEATAERRRADTLAQQFDNKTKTLIWDHTQEFKRERGRRERLESEASLLRTKVIDEAHRTSELAARASQLESELAAARQQLLTLTQAPQPRQETPIMPNPPAVTSTALLPLEGMALTVYLRQQGHTAHYEPDSRRVVCAGLSVTGLAAEYLRSQELGDPRTFLHGHLHDRGLL